MSNAAKHRKKAAEFEQLKQIDRAIASYIRAVEESETEGADVDVALLNKVGDLTLRQGRVADAVTYYERAVEHYATAGLFNNAIALCNKILRSAPGRANVYFTLGRICAKKGLRGDATRNFLEYATRMQQEGRVEEAMHALAEVADLMPELTEVRRLVEEHAARAGIVLRRKTPASTPAVETEKPVQRFDNKSSELVFLDLGGGDGFTRRNTPPLSPRIPTPAKSVPGVKGPSRTPMRPTTGVNKTVRPTTGVNKVVPVPTQSLEDFMLFDPNRPTPTEPLRALTPVESLKAVTPVSSPAIVAPESRVEPVAEVVTDTPPVAAEPVIEPRETLAESVVELPVEAVVEAVVELPVEAVVGAVVELPVEAVVEAAVELPVEAVIDAVVEVPVEAPAEVVAEVVAESIPEPTVEAPVELPIEAQVEPQPEPQVEPPIEAQVEPALETEFEPPVDVPVASAEGLESYDFAGAEVEALEGLTSDEFDPTIATPSATPEVNLAWLMPPENIDGTHLSLDDHATVDEGDNGVPGDVLAGLMIEDFDHVADDPQAVVVTGTMAGTPTYNDEVPTSLTPLDVSPIPELDAAIEAGAMTAASADADPELSPRHPPFRLDPHNFILPGELPPLMVEDELVFAGMQFAINAVDAALSSASEDVDIAESVSAAEVAVSGVETSSAVESESVDEASTVDAAHVAAPADASATQSPELSVEEPAETDDESDEEEFESLLRETIESDHVVRSTPSLHIAAVAAEANAVATSRREELQAAVLRAPHDWVLRRRLAEALFEVGEREGGLTELQSAVFGFAQSGDLTAAADIADQLVGIAPEQIQYHQKRVELAIRLEDQHRLRAAYLDLADTLVRMSDDVRAHAVYARVLEIDPWDERARAALGGAAPPPPQPTDAPPEDFVSLAEWLQDDEPGTTRMRMREPQVSGDEQADFDTLLRHFKEGVARSLGEEDFESHYDLGVAYKEMGLLDDAISEFQKALRSRRHRLPAYEALGQCFVEQSRHSVAATVLSRAVHEPGPGDEHRVGVLYLLAYSCEALQRWDEARSYYSRVYATDIHFRDVAARLAALDLVAR